MMMHNEAAFYTESTQCRLLNLNPVQLLMG